MPFQQIFNTIQGTDEGFHGSNLQSCSAHPLVGDRGPLTMRGCNKSMTVDNEFGECHTCCTLETSFVDFEKE